MNLKSITIALAVTLAVSFCQAQTSTKQIKEDFKPSTLNQPGQDYPRINSQGYVRFRLKAPDSIRVTLALKELAPLLFNN